jgi:uncharacterized protein YbjT (DUF2867 family)
MSTPFRVLFIGGTGQVGAAAVRALAAEPSCIEVVMINRKPLAELAALKVRQVILDTGSAEFETQIFELSKALVAQGERVCGASCVGVGAGSNKWTEEELKALELGVVGAFARGCRAAGINQFALLSAVGSNSKSSFKYIRVMGLKEEMARSIGFNRLALFQPGIIGGNVHTPRVVDWLGRMIPGKFGTIDQTEMGRAFVAEFKNHAEKNGVEGFENGAMRALSRQL